MASERELKFSSTGDRRPSSHEVVSVLGSGGYLVTADGERLQRDRYFDDAVGSLSGAGIALRRRTVAGERLATLKTAGEVRGALHRREELELPLAGTGWPGPILMRISGLVDVATLRNRLTLTTRRDHYRVARDDGSAAPVATVSFDEVEASRPGGSHTVRFSEVEIEALGATEDDELARLAGLLERLVPLNPSGATKLERATALLELATWES